MIFQLSLRNFKCFFFLLFSCSFQGPIILGSAQNLAGSIEPGSGAIICRVQRIRIQKYPPKYPLKYSPKIPQNIHLISIKKSTKIQIHPKYPPKKPPKYPPIIFTKDPPNNKKKVFSKLSTKLSTKISTKKSTKILGENVVS